MSPSRAPSRVRSRGAAIHQSHSVTHSGTARLRALDAFTCVQTRAQYMLCLALRSRPSVAASLPRVVT